MRKGICHILHVRDSNHRHIIHRTNIQDYVKEGFRIPISIQHSRIILDGALVPHVIVDQISTNELGEIIENNRLTCDQSLDFSE